MDDSEQNELDTLELLGWAEFACWTALVLTPLIWWLQGPSVSHDQFVVRTALVVIAAVGAVTLRLAALFRQFRIRSEGSGRASEAASDSKDQSRVGHESQ